MNKTGHVASRMVLGTAQLGMTYGIANTTGQPDRRTAFAIVEAAYRNGIREFDTAQIYGESEAILGHIFGELGVTKDVKVTTKLNPRMQEFDELHILKSVENSLKLLRVDQLEGFLLHHEEMMRGVDAGTIKGVEKICRDGFARKLGVSVYSPEKAARALESELYGIVHVPLNILDRRFINAGIFAKARDAGKAIYIRSAFLQGLLLMDAKEVPKNLAAVIPALAEVERIATSYGLTRRALALIYLRDKFTTARVIFGAEISNQVKQNIDEWNTEVPEGLLEKIEKFDPRLDESILNPSRWSHLI